MLAAMKFTSALTLRSILAALRMLAAVWLVWAAPALAQEGAGQDAALAPSCLGYAHSPVEADRLLATGSGWTCGAKDWQASSRHTLLRFDLGPDGKVPSHYSTRLARFEGARILIERPDGAVSTHRIASREFVPRGNMRIAVPLPEAGTPARRITIDLIAPTNAGMIGDSRLHYQDLPLIGPDQIWIAMLCGLLLVPLFFNVALYRALGDRFLLWHVGVVAFMLGHTLVSSGFTNLLIGIPVSSLALMVVIAFSGGAACALMMASEFIEPDKLSRRMRQALRFGALWLALNAGLFVTTIDWLQGRGTSIYFANWIVVVAILVVAMASAVRRGSRAAKFLVASWLPVLVTGIWQIGESLLGSQSEPLTLFVIQRFAIGAEVLITSIGIADRFIQLRRDRDDHLILASKLSRLAERDPLTGLLNRRAIESRFAALRADGFATMALLDLDQFKAINDRFGHAAGDDVLRAVAASLPEDANVLPVRMGGEEFLLLLRGKRAVQRAEQVRLAITARVARDVPGLDRPVSASMGLVEIPAEVIPDASFASIYARADGLLYQAKRAGRNRTVSERMTIFARPAARETRAA